MEHIKNKTVTILAFISFSFQSHTKKFVKENGTLIILTRLGKIRHLFLHKMIPLGRCTILI